MSDTEAHVELMLGRHVRDIDGVVVGRLEEFLVEKLHGEDVVTEYHIGGAAFLERVATFVAQLPLIKLLPVLQTEYRVRWQDVDISDPRHPKLRVRKQDLRRVPRDARL